MVWELVEQEARPLSTQTARPGSAQLSTLRLDVEQDKLHENGRSRSDVTDFELTCMLSDVYCSQLAAEVHISQHASQLNLCGSKPGISELCNDSAYCR